MEGRFLHICLNGTQRFLRVDMKNRIMDPGTFLPVVPSTAVVGQKCAMSYMIDGSTKLAFLYNATSSLAVMSSIAISR